MGQTLVGSKAAFLLRPIWAIIVALAAALGLIIPKDRRTWVFGNFKGFGDNSRYLLEYVAHQHPEVRPIWLARSRQHRDEARSAGYESELVVSPRGLWLAFRARVAVVQNGSRDLNRAALPGQFVVNLWHGTPFKRILLDSQAESVQLPVVGPLLTRLGRGALWASLRTTDLLISPSEHVSSLFASAFRIEPSRVVVTGAARTDIILGSPDRVDDDRRFRILVAPTWRGSATQIDVFPGFDPETWNSTLQRWDAVLAFKLHPLMRDDVGSAIQLLHENHVEHIPSQIDINPILGRYSLLVTDYSAIAFDFALLRRPIFFVCPDEEAYSAAWGLYEPMSSLVGEALCDDFEALRQSVERCLHDRAFPDPVIRRLTSERFLRYDDRLNRCRIHREILRRLDGPSLVEATHDV